MGEDLLQDTRTDDELDKLADSSGGPRNGERPMKEAPAPKDAGKEKALSPWAEDEFEHSGKKIKGTREEILKWAAMGYDRPQVMQKFNQERQAWERTVAEREAQYKQWEQKWGHYRQIDDWAQQNPQHWNLILQTLQQWQQGGSPGAAQGGSPGAAAGAGAAPGAGASGVYDPRYDALAKKFDTLASELVEQRTLEKQKQEDDALEGEVQSIRKQYPDLDWNSLDQDGKTLEIRVMEHAGKIGTQSFRAAMRDLLHDELLTRAESQGKLAVAKGIQQKTKLGVLGESPTPKSRMPAQNRNIRETSYEDLEREIREELRSGRQGH